MSELGKETESAMPKKRGPRGGTDPAGNGTDPAKRTVAPDKPAPKKKAAVRRTPAKKKPGGEAPAVAPHGPISAEERIRLISESAYYKAEARSFRGGDPERDWLEAEAEIDAMLLQERPAKD